MMMVDAEIKLPNNLPYSLIALAVLVKGAKKDVTVALQRNPRCRSPKSLLFTIDS